MKKTIILIIIAALLPLFTGCNTSDDFNYIERAIRDQIYPAKLKKNFKFSFGSLSQGIVTSFTNDDNEADMYLKEINSVQVGLYKVHNIKKSKAFQIPRNVEKCLIEKGWEPFVRVRERGGENIALFYKQLSNNAASIYTIVLERDELVIVEINGNLDMILEKAIQEHGLSVVAKI